MDLYDSEKAARVWQRVHPGNGSGLNEESLNSFIFQLRQLFSLYRKLSTQVSPIHSFIPRSLSDQKRTQAACLRGLFILSIGPCPEPPLPSLPKEPLLATLRRCYAMEAQLLTQFEIHSAGPSHGPVFAALASEQKSHCRSILHLVGLMER